MPICIPCNKKFPTYDRLDKHQASGHCVANKKDFKCDNCQYTTNHKQNFTRHMVSCNNKKMRMLEKHIQTQEREIQQLKINQTEQKKEIAKNNNKKKCSIINNNYIIANFNNALNIEDCIAPENITDEMLNKCKKLPMKDGTLYILDNLCNIDPNIRPFHCTDISRNNYLVRSENNWTIDNGGEKIKDNMKPVVESVYKEVHRESLTIQDRDEKLRRLELMAKELLDDNINKSCKDALKQSSGKYAVKNLPSDNTLIGYE